MNEDDRKRLRAMIEGADWPDLTTRLLGVARFCLAQNDRRLAGSHGTTADQFVMRAVMDVLRETYEPVLMRSLFDIIATRIAYLIYVDLRTK
jgi:hypothetical protein